MKKQTNTLFIFWGLAFILVACLLPFMAKENNFLNQFLLKYLVENNYNVAYYTQHNISNILYIF